MKLLVVLLVGIAHAALMDPLPLWRSVAASFCTSLVTLLVAEWAGLISMLAKAEQEDR